MKKYISTVLALVIVVVFLDNIDSVVQYEEDVVPAFASDESPNSQPLQDIEGDNGYNKYNDLPSIQEFSLDSGNLTSSNLTFSEPDLLAEEIKEEDDNKKIYFFGDVTDSDWEKVETTPTPTAPTQTVDESMKEPIEVTLDKFLN